MLNYLQNMKCFYRLSHFMEPAKLKWFIPILLFSLVYIEISIFVTVANKIGVFFSMLLILLTCLVGIAIVKVQGIKNAAQLKEKLAAGNDPTMQVVKNISLILAAVLFIFPGFFTDIIGIILLIPFVQKHLIKRFIKFVKITSSTAKYSNQNNGSVSKITIEGEFVRKNDDNESNK